MCVCWFQGSVLDVILFLIYSNDLYEGRFYGQVTAFTDDTVLLYNNPALDLLQNSIQLGSTILKYYLVKMLWF